MKHLRTVALCASITVFSLCASAQTGNIPINEPNYNKPSMFSSLPDNIPVDLTAVNGLFGSFVGTNISISLSPTVVFRIDGQVVSQVNKYDNQIQSVVLRSTNYDGARLTISKVTDASGTVTYTGRILSMGHGDLFELKDVAGQLYFVKRKFNYMIAE